MQRWHGKHGRPEMNPVKVAGAPWLPPVSLSAGYVPDACHATRIAIGHAFTLRFMSAEYTRPPTPSDASTDWRNRARATLLRACAERIESALLDKDFDRFGALQLDRERLVAAAPAAQGR